MRIFAGSVVVLLLAAGVGALWLTDRIAWQGETTVYTVRCEGGSWDRDVCTGRLVQAERYRYRTLRNRREVLFWVLGESTPSRKLTDCEIKDGRNWTCPASAEAVHSIALQMQRGRAAHDESGSARDFHDVPKWRWLLLSTGRR